MHTQISCKLVVQAWLWNFDAHLKRITNNSIYSLYIGEVKFCQTFEQQQIQEIFTTNL